MLYVIAAPRRRSFGILFLLPVTSVRAVAFLSRLKRLRSHDY